MREYAQRLSQLKAGNLHYLTRARAEDDLTIKRDEPRILMYESDFATTVQPMTFGHLPVGGSKFNDERVTGDLTDCSRALPSAVEEVRSLE